MNALLKVSNLSYQPTREISIKYPDFIIDRGDTVSIEGRNGSGKTSLLFVLAGLYPVNPDCSIQLDDSVVSDRNTQRSYCGLALPGVGENSSVTAKVLVRSMVALSGADESSVQRVLKGSGIENFWHSRFGKCSTGQKLRVKLAQAFISQGPLVLLDEPTNGLDLDGVQWLQSQIDLARSSGRAVLATNHDDQLRFDKRIVIGLGE